MESSAIAGWAILGCIILVGTLWFFAKRADCNKVRNICHVRTRHAGLKAVELERDYYDEHKIHFKCSCGFSYWRYADRLNDNEKTLWANYIEALKGLVE
jgi:hypothetical protein